MLKKLLALVAVISVALSVAAFAACEKKDHIYKEDGDDNNTVITPNENPDDGEQETPDDQTPDDGEQEDTDEEENKVPSIDLPIIW